MSTFTVVFARMCLVRCKKKKQDAGQYEYKRGDELAVPIGECSALSHKSDLSYNSTAIHEPETTVWKCYTEWKTPNQIGFYCNP